MNARFQLYFLLRRAADCTLPAESSFGNAKLLQSLASARHEPRTPVNAYTPFAKLRSTSLPASNIPTLTCQGHGESTLGLDERGLVYPVDSLYSFHPPSHPELLDWLARDFAASGYDIRRLMKALELATVCFCGISLGENRG